MEPREFNGDAEVDLFAKFLVNAVVRSGTVGFYPSKQTATGVVGVNAPIDGGERAFHVPPHRVPVDLQRRRIPGS